MGTGDILLRGNPAMDQHPIQGGVAILLGMLHAKETGISSGRLWPAKCKKIPKYQNCSENFAMIPNVRNGSQNSGWIGFAK